MVLTTHCPFLRTLISVMAQREDWPNKGFKVAKGKKSLHVLYFINGPFNLHLLH